MMQQHRDLGHKKQENPYDEEKKAATGKKLNQKQKKLKKTGKV